MLMYQLKHFRSSSENLRKSSIILGKFRKLHPTRLIGNVRRIFGQLSKNFRDALWYLQKFALNFVISLEEKFNN